MTCYDPPCNGNRIPGATQDDWDAHRAQVHHEPAPSTRIDLTGNDNAMAIPDAERTP